MDYRGHRGNRMTCDGGHYHGLRRPSLNAINHLVGRALEEAADADAVKAARRFSFEHRERIYRAAALSRRALQLTETFPVLALAIYSERWQARRYGEPSDTEIRFNSEAADLSSRKTEAMHLVDRGARLRDVAGVMNIPITLRHIKPGVAHLGSSVAVRRSSIRARGLRIRRPPVHAIDVAQDGDGIECGSRRRRH